MKSLRFRQRRASLRRTGERIIKLLNGPIDRSRSPIERDLFDGASVTAGEVAAWLAAVPGMDPASPRAAWYIQAYRVPEKIRAAKLAGTWPAILDRCTT